MIEQYNAKQVISLSKQFTDAAFRAQGLALASFERAVGLQLKTIENRVNAAVEFANEASEVRDLETAKAFVPKSVSLAKDSAEKFYAVSQELVGISVKTGEAIGELLRTNFEAANETVTVKPVARKASK